MNSEGDDMAAMVRRLRLERAWSQEDLAAVSGLNVRTIQRIENGGKASLETLKSLAAAMDIAVTQLSPGTPSTANPEARTMTATTLSPAGLGRHTPEGRKRAFRHHLAVYAVVIAGLAAIDLITSPGHLWFHYPALGWGIGVALQGLRAYFRG